ncbi:MAG: acetyl esterase/lipase [Bradymonadia bacterium]|jgi:acetyl esterase/lipase
MHPTLIGLLIAGCSSTTEPAANSGSQPDAEDVAEAVADTSLDAEDSADTVGDAGADATQTLVGACSEADPSSCAYEPAQIYQVGGRAERTVVYTDITGSERSVRIEIRRPVEAAEPSPLIVWSHGGGSGRSTAVDVAVAWGEIFNQAGFVSIAIAHDGRGVEESRELCLALNLGGCELVSCDMGESCTRGAAPDEEIGICVADPTLGGGYCRYLRPLHWDRPHDFSAVLDWVEDQASTGMLDGVVDVDRIAYAGHSAGSGATMMIAGAARFFRASAGDQVLVDTRPVAFMSCSPQGPDDSGFTTTSFTRERCEELAAPEDRAGCLSRPHLVLTSIGDGGDQEGGNRRLSFDLAPEGDRYLAYITEPAAQHTTFNYETSGCERYAQDNALGSEFPARCNTYRLWLRSAALAFFDATLRDSAEARAYLESDNIRLLAGAALEWTAR